MISLPAGDGGLLLETIATASAAGVSGFEHYRFRLFLTATDLKWPDSLHV